MSRRFSLATASLLLLIAAAAGQERVELDATFGVNENDDLGQVTSSTPEPNYPDGVNTIPGDAEVHYPIYGKIFKTSFSCTGRLPGFYADIEARCQIWHICDVDERMQSFLCTNGTIFSQETRVCEWWYNTNCDANFVKKNYDQNKDLYVTFKEDDFVTTEKYRGQDQGQRSNKKQPHLTPEAPENPARPRPSAQPKHSAQPKPDAQPKLSAQPKQTARPKPARKPSPPVPAARPDPIQRSAETSPPRAPETNQRQENTARNREAPPTSNPYTELTREELEERRQAARAEFYSIPAKLEQEKRVSQQRFQEEQRQRALAQQQPDDPTIAAFTSPVQEEHSDLTIAAFTAPAQRQRNEPKVAAFTVPTQRQRNEPTVAAFTAPTQRQRNEPTIAAATAPTKRQRSDPTIAAPTSTPFLSYPFTTFPPLESETTPKSPVSGPKHKFRHSTPRKHNVSFRSPPSSTFSDNDEERQVPEETKRKGFPVPPYFRNKGPRKGQKVQEGQEVTGQTVPPHFFTNGYLPTSNEPIPVAPTVPETQSLPEVSSGDSSHVSPAPKLRPRKRRPRPAKKQNLAPTSVPPPVLSYRPPSPAPELLRLTAEKNMIADDVNRSKVKPAKEPRIVVKRKFRNQSPPEHGEQTNQNDFPRNSHPTNQNDFPGNSHQTNQNDFPGNSHLEQSVDDQFKEGHATQKRCAVIGTGNVFKVFC